MMLKPFRVRNLYGQDHGVVQITAIQYNSTIKSQPDAVLTYLDEDDGEVITVGSSLELVQRLDEPAFDEQPMADNPMHIFDTCHTETALATWREHEAYTSKSRRRTSFKASDADQQSHTVSDLGMWTTDSHGRPKYDRYVPRSPLEHGDHSNARIDERVGMLTVRDDGPRSPVLGLDDWSTMSSGRPASENPENISRDEASIENTSPAESQSNKTSVARDPTTIQDQLQVAKFDSIFGDALRGLDTHLGGFADFLDVTAKTFRDAAEKSHETDTSVMEGLLGGFTGILTEVGKVGRSMLETLDTEESALAKDLAPMFERKNDLERRINQENTPKEDVPVIEEVERTKENPTTESTTLPRDCSAITDSSEPTSVQPKPEEPQPKPWSTFAWWDEDDLKASKDQSTLTDRRGQRSVSKPRFPTQPVPPPMPKPWGETPWCDIPNRSSLQFNFHGTTPDGPNPLVPPPKTPNQQSLPGVSCVLNEEPIAATKEAPFPSKSILDLEASDPDFSTRFPPLISLRRARTVDALKGAAKINLNTQTALHKYPSIDQLERLNSPKAESSHAPKLTKGSVVTVEEVEDDERTQFASASPSLIDNRARIAGLNDQRPAQRVEANAARPLPGSWPEPTTDTYATSESSGTFCERMLCHRTSRGRDTKADTLVDIRSGNSYGFRYVDSNASNIFKQPPRQVGLQRSQTVTASNPAARLTKPFDPFAPNHRHIAPLARGFVPLFPGHELRRSGTECLASRPRRSGGVTFDPFATEPAPRSTAPVPEPRGPRPVRSEPHSNLSRAPPHAPPSGPVRRTKVDDCVSTLRMMGYGQDDPHEAGRLHVYAAASGGVITDAIEMIEDDRKAAFNVWKDKKETRTGRMRAVRSRRGSWREGDDSLI